LEKFPELLEYIEGHPHPARPGAHTNPGLLTAQTGAFGISTTLGNTKFTISPPPKFNPKEHTWLIWKPRVLDYFVTIGLEGVLEPSTGSMYHIQTNRYVISALQSMSPDAAAASMTTLQCRFAHEALAQMEKKYGSRPDLDLQQRMFAFETAAQQEKESIRDWVIRLERMVVELNLMAKEAAKLSVGGCKQHRDVAVYVSAHKMRLLNIRVDDHAQEAHTASLRVQLSTISVKKLEAELISYEQGRNIQRSLTHGAGSSPQMWHTTPHGTPQPLVCFACDGVGHGWQCCRETLTNKAGTSCRPITSVLDRISS
jgi:hypothetical protein